MINYFNNTKSTTSTVVENISAKTNSVKKSKTTSNQEETFITKEQTTSTNTNSQSNNIVESKDELFIKAIVQKNQEKISKTINAYITNKNISLAENNEKQQAEPNEINSTKQMKTPIDLERMYHTRANLLPIQSFIQTTFPEKQIPQYTTQSLLANTIAAKDSSTKNIKRKWFITSSAGLLFNVSTLDAQFGLNNSGSLASGARSNRISYPNGNVFMLGGGFQQQLSKKWSYNIALQYKLLSAPLNSVDSSLFIQSNKYRAHWIQIPINFSYQLNNSAHPFYLTAGLSGAYAFASNWSYADLTNNRFYNDKTKNRKLFINAQIGAVYTIQKDWLMKVSVERSLTSVHRKVPDKFYYTQFNIQLFKFIQSKNKK
ncbi:MAG: PorT family protein [Chitinophagaceae bacterium]|nr:PorT family protein [Chitinophagaceae bacterium]